MKNSKIRNGKIVRQEELQGPAVATGTTVTSAKSAARLMFPWIPEKEN